MFQKSIYFTESSYSLWVYNFGTSVSPPLPSLYLSLFQSPFFSHPLTPPSISLSHTLLISLSPSFPPFLSFHLRLFNLWGGYEREWYIGELVGERRRETEKEREIEVEREKGEWNRCAEIVYLQWIWTLCDINILLWRQQCWHFNHGTSESNTSVAIRRSSAISRAEIRFESKN